jgi:hypothetical protein
MCDTHLGGPLADPEQAAAPPTIGDIFREYGSAYRRKYADRMSRDQLQVLDLLTRCRTGALGTAVYRCDEYRVAISNRRIVKCEPGPDDLGRVTFTYRRKGSQRYRAMTVTAYEFIRRFLQHVLPRGLQKVRHYGFAHPRQRIDVEWLKMLVTVTLNAVYVLLVAAKPPPAPHRPSCPDCGGALTCVGFLPAEDRWFAAPNTS